ncbi:hypothetical protein Bbelb_208220 [Branchiostoma belcheri]|nr:hypothetical protein Bbelb_208220 [Branchiostoma belcheri]
MEAGSSPGLPGHALHTGVRAHAQADYVPDMMMMAGNLLSSLVSFSPLPKIRSLSILGSGLKLTRLDSRLPALLFRHMPTCAQEIPFFQEEKCPPSDVCYLSNQSRPAHSREKHSNVPLKPRTRASRE